jgi:hypothetical protein
MPMASRSLLALLLFASSCVADVKFTTPAAGADIAAGTINVEWEDSGIAPALSSLTGYILSLMVGGNEDGDMVRI